MNLESKHIIGLRSMARWLRTRGDTFMAKKLGWDHMMRDYAKDCEDIANELEKLNLPKTTITLDQLFGKEQ